MELLVPGFSLVWSCLLWAFGEQTGRWTVKQQMVVQAFGLLPSMWETVMGLLALASVDIWGSESVDRCPLHCFYCSTFLIGENNEQTKRIQSNKEHKDESELLLCGIGIAIKACVREG